MPHATFNALTSRSSAALDELGPEAIGRRLEDLRGSALIFRNLTNYIARSLFEAGGFKPQLHPQMR